MSVKIGHASIDENGNGRGGKAGDQTRKEVCVREWYDKNWNKVIRPNNEKIAKKIADAMEAACANDNIGYNMNNRNTLYIEAKKKGWDISKITNTCETDCSALVRVCVCAAGIDIPDIFTGNEAEILKNTGKFKVLTDKKYLRGDGYLKRGDILLNELSHTAIVLSNGSEVVKKSFISKPNIKKDKGAKKEKKQWSVSDEGVNMIASFEGLRLEAYKCPAGVWTIGYGHTKGVKENDKLDSENEAKKLLKKDLKIYEGYVIQCIKNKKITFEMTQNRFDALTSFTYNLGAGCLETLVSGRNAETVAEKILLYNKAGGKVLEGLNKRREMESELFLKK